MICMHSNLQAPQVTVNVCRPTPIGSMIEHPNTPEKKPRPPILVIEDDPTTSEILCAVLANGNLNPIPFRTGHEALTHLEKNPNAGALLVDIMLPDLDGIELLREARKIHKGLPCYMLTAKNDTQSVVLAIKAGANDYFTKPFDSQVLIAELVSALDTHALDCRRYEVSTPLDNRWKSPKMCRALKDAKCAAKTNQPVVIAGPHDTGKARFARMIHDRSDPPLQSFVQVDLATLPDERRTSELFGEPMTGGAIGWSRLGGYLERCKRSTLFIENVDQLDPSAQGLFLEWFKERSDVRKYPQRVRLICSTSAQMEPLIAAGRFRRDLWYQLAVHLVEVPSLAERVMDLPMLCEDMLTEICVKGRLRRPTITAQALELICGYSWPYNLTELQNTLAHAVADTSDGLITPVNLSRIKKLDPIKERDLTNLGAASIEELTKASLVSALELCGGNRRKVATRLGVSLRTVYNMINRYNVPISTGRRA